MFQSAFKPGYCLRILAQAQVPAQAHRLTLGSSLSTDIPKCLIGYHQYIRLLASHRLDPLRGSQPRDCV